MGQIFRIDVTTSLKDDELDPDDRDVAHIYALELDAATGDLEAQKERALDVFHDTIPIAVLEDFEIECRAAERDTIPAGATWISANSLHLRGILPRT